MLEGRIMGLFGLAMLVTYANIVVAMLFRGEVSLWRIGDAELYAYSAVWLAFGLAAAGQGPSSAAGRCASPRRRWWLSPC